MFTYNFRYAFLWFTLMRSFAEARLIVGVFPNVAVAGQRFVISCISNNVSHIRTVSIYRNLEPVYTIQYVGKICKGGGHICVHNCSCSTDTRNLSWIIQSLPETWHNAEIKCVDPTGYASESDVYELSISVTFTEIIISLDNTVVVNSGTKLLASCVTSPASRPAATITWIKVKKGKRSDLTEKATSDFIHTEGDDKTITNSTLFYTPDKSDNGDIIFCTATDVTGTNKQSKKRKIVVRFRNLTLTVTPTIFQGDDVQIVCDITGGNPLADLHFSCGSQHSKNNTYNNTASRKVILLNISKDYNGVTCSCSATHVLFPSFRKQKNITLHVFYPPEVTIIRKQEPVENSKLFSLSCDADGNPKRYTYYKWRHFYNGVLIRELIADKVLKFQNPLSFQDSGKYVCRVSNDVKDKDSNQVQSSSTAFSVKVGPMFITPKRDVLIGEKSGSLNINVEFVTFPDIISTRWINVDGKISDGAITGIVPCPISMTFYGVDILVTEYGYTSWLNFTNFESIDRGNYLFIVANEIRESIYSFKTKFSGPPDNPISFHVDVITSKSIDLSWIAGANNGHNQSFSVTCQGSGTEPKFINLRENTSKSVYNLSLDNLFPSTIYEVSLYAWNKKGKCPDVLKETIITKKGILTTSPAGTAIAAGGCSLVLILALSLGIYICRSKKTNHPDGGIKPKTVSQGDEPYYDEISVEQIYINDPTRNGENTQTLCVEMNSTANQKNDPKAGTTELQTRGTGREGIKPNVVYGLDTPHIDETYINSTANKPVEFDKRTTSSYVEMNRLENQESTDVRNQRSEKEETAPIEETYINSTVNKPVEFDKRTNPSYVEMNRLENQESSSMALCTEVRNQRSEKEDDLIKPYIFYEPENRYHNDQSAEEMYVNSTADKPVEINKRASPSYVGMNKNNNLESNPRTGCTATRKRRAETGGDSSYANQSAAGECSDEKGGEQVDPFLEN